MSLVDLYDDFGCGGDSRCADGCGDGSGFVGHTAGCGWVDHECEAGDDNSYLEAGFGSGEGPGNSEVRTNHANQ